MDGPQGIRSVETGLALLGIVAAGAGPMRLSEVAAAARTSPSRARGYLVSLVRAGYVAQDGAGRYALGAAALDLGLVALGRLDALAACRAAMAPLAAELGETVALSLWSERGPVVVDKIESGDRIYEVRVGAAVTLWPTATGRVFLAWLSPGRWEGLLDLPAGEHERLPALLDETRAAGVAGTLPATVPGFSALAAPVLDHRGELRAVLTVLGRAESFDIGRDGAAAAALRAAAEGASRALGHRAGA
ncbi:IclR family transcriptional regulator [Wenxinia marina]|uniref:Wenxma_14, whole genome shotgun sequence n=1 Tax=Wenxinia marina DSM 24838 TaxID=1123501 RepID=A0A0D0Q770_9RHOB|nr:helix-turn-helix domain-containing protein [Wenxinia marina]KIQ68312.1 transcriptional regulator, IclR family [Wenxinia marina DSM 24838]GGL79661.1 transcriptional regulator [Wenxinia marina]